MSCIIESNIKYFFYKARQKGKSCSKEYCKSLGSLNENEKSDELKRLESYTKDCKTLKSSCGMLSVLEMTYIIKYMKYKLKNNEKIELINSSSESPDVLKRKIESLKNVELVLYLQYISIDKKEEDEEEDGDGEFGGHWIVNVLDKINNNKIYIFNTLPSWKPRHYILQNAYPESELIEVNTVKQQGATCGYWSLFICFIVINFHPSIHGLNHILFGCQYQINNFIKFVKSFTDHLKQYIKI